jgi:hypothetical protein
VAIAPHRLGNSAANLASPFCDISREDDKSLVTDALGSQADMRSAIAHVG